MKGGADLKARDDGGSTPLHEAASWNRNPEVLGALLEAGASPNARDKRKNTPLHGAVTRKKDAGVVGLLLRAGANPNARDQNGHTTLHNAAWNKNPAVVTDVIAPLLKAGADPNAQNKYGDTPLHNATGSRTANLAVTVALLKAGADPNVPNEYDDTPLHDAAANSEDLAVITALLKAGANPNARFDDSSTPLHSAVAGENPAAIAALLEAGADPSIPDFFGNTPMDDARKKNNPAVIAALPKEVRRAAPRTQTARSGSGSTSLPTTRGLFDRPAGNAPQRQTSAAGNSGGGCADGPICRQTVKNAEVVLKRVEELLTTRNLGITDSSLAGAFTTRASIACMKACLEREETRTDCRNGIQQAIGELQKSYDSAVLGARSAAADYRYVDQFEASPQNSSFGREFFSQIQGNLDTCGY